MSVSRAPYHLEIVIGVDQDFRAPIRYGEDLAARIEDARAASELEPGLPPHAVGGDNRCTVEVRRLRQNQRPAVRIGKRAADRAVGGGVRAQKERSTGEREEMNE
jgi:hypothetical protein